MKTMVLTDEQKQKIINEFIAKLNNTISSDKITININNEINEPKTRKNLYYTTKAFSKMIMLVEDFDSEIGWYGIVHKTEDGYIISDIIVYKQEVTGAKVDQSDEDAFEFYKSLTDDQINNMKFQGHSHVNMSPTPSSVDLKNWEDISNTLTDNQFYIFQIWNKSMRFSTKIYDKEDNRIYENDDVNVTVITEDEDLSEFLNDARKKVTKKSNNIVYTKAEKIYSEKKENVPTQKSETAKKDTDDWFLYKNCKKQKENQTKYYKANDYYNSFFSDYYDANDYILNNMEE